MKSRIAVAAALAGPAVLLCAGPAFAHVTVEPSAAQQGSYTKIVFRVPNERDNAATTKVDVHFPADHPIASVETQPVPGWTAKVTTAKLAKPLTTDDGKVTEAVTEIVWTGNRIAPGSFQEFPVSLGPLPSDTGSLVFKALQTYSNGDVVRWIQLPKPGQDEPENPAPTLTLTKAAPDTTTASSAKGTPAKDDAATTDASSDSSDGTARALGIAGIAVGVIGTAVGALGLRRRGSTPSA
jgi:uncharacterized protein YcnI